MPTRNGRYQFHDLVLHRRFFANFRDAFPRHRFPMPGRQGWDLATYRQVVEYFRSYLLPAYIQEILPVRHELQTENIALQHESENRAVTIGADPEFEVLLQVGHVYEVAHAADYIPGGTHSAIGVDGASHTGEIRPNYGTPEVCFDSVRSLLTSLASTLPNNIKIQAGAGVVHPLGGHIHVGGLAERPSSLTLEALDRFITVPLNRHASKVRRISGYGVLSELRQQPHGWEYRSPCSWLAHPDLTMGALAIAYVIFQIPSQTVATLRTTAELLDVMGDYRAAAERFYNYLSSLTTQLESVDVFRAWEIPHEQEFSVVIRFADDNMEFLRVCAEARTSLRQISIRGAASHRGQNTIFIPAWLERAAYLPLDNDINFVTWDFDMIGLSSDLRERAAHDSETAQHVRSLIEQIIHAN